MFEQIPRFATGLHVPVTLFNTRDFDPNLSLPKLRYEAQIAACEPDTSTAWQRSLSAVKLVPLESLFNWEDWSVPIGRGGIPYLGILIYAQVRTGLRCAYKGERSLAQTALRRYTHMVNVHDGIRARRLVQESIDPEAVSKELWKVTAERLGLSGDLVNSSLHLDIA